MSIDKNGRQAATAADRESAIDTARIAPSTGKRPAVGAALARQETAVHRFPETGQEIRTVRVGGEAWLVAMDVCRALEIGRTHDAVRGLDSDERGTASIRTPGGDQQVSIVSEAGFYALTLRSRSRKDDVRAFRRWVTHEVIPSIYRPGNYWSVSGPAASLDSPEAILQLAAAYHAAAELLVGARQRAAALEPAARAWETLAEAEGDYSLRDAAHILNRDPAISTGQNRLMRLLRDEGMVDRRGVPYAKHARHLVERPITYEHPHTHEVKLSSQVRVTVDGLEYLRRRLSGTGTKEAA